MTTQVNSPQTEPGSLESMQACKKALKLSKEKTKAIPADLKAGYECALEEAKGFLARTNEVLKGEISAEDKSSLASSMERITKFLELIRTQKGLETRDFSIQNFQRAVKALTSGAPLTSLKPDVFQHIVVFRFMQVMAEAGDKNATRFLKNNSGCSAVVQQLSAIPTN